jgi:ATP-dependent Lon protease
MSDIQVVSQLPILCVKEMNLFPEALLPVAVGRSASIAAVEAALSSEEKTLVVLAQKDRAVEEPAMNDLYRIGTRAVIKRMARGEAGLELVLQGVERMQLTKMDSEKPFLKGEFEPLPMTIIKTTEAEALRHEVQNKAVEFFSLAQSENSPTQLSQMAAGLTDSQQLISVLGMILPLDLERAQVLLEANTDVDALRLLLGYLDHETQVLELRKKIASAARTELNKEQKEYLLRQQLEAIHKELGDTAGTEADVQELRERLQKIEFPETVNKVVQRQLSRLSQTPPASPDHQVIRTYLELIGELPWTAATQDRIDLARAREILDEDHYDLTEIKDRIIEHLAVLKLNPGAKAPILCFVGPPGVGKTSLGHSIARALERKFERLSLGGMHDEAELRGHRRTYIGAMPGRIIEAIRRAGVKNPVLMLDEADKLGQDFRGDPAAALLEILDPAQNFEFRDNYLDLPLDLSSVFFVTTANTIDTIPRPLLDRMELLRLSGYSDEEKLQIARRYLLPRQREQAGLTEEQFSVSDSALLTIIRKYTREAGVRELERMLGRLARKMAVRVAMSSAELGEIEPGQLENLLGTERFFLEQVRHDLPAGVSIGLAWTEAGGDILYIEAMKVPEPQLMLTGQLGNVMKESAQAARSYVVGHAEALGIEGPIPGVHLHVPAGAIPKDGPSAGVAMATALASLFTNRPIRSDTAMTGEITLSGLVLPVGGIKEKVLAARRAGLKRVILPFENQRDLRDLPEQARTELEFVFARRVEEVLEAAIPELAPAFSS